jgi:hypothetical protein
MANILSFAYLVPGKYAGAAAVLGQERIEILMGS